ncbi:hypothetical protein [Mucilaginibacter sp. OK098]|uniref:hypothetical protein n=1 Tax=Mucilaginibacter sp. OK098 TaxID=1855297 RepID=UPI001160FA82|nr:hypothetical protein [Mucilaginibacter sp. OK098]
MKKISILILSVMILASACKKEKKAPQLTGTYTGSFSETTPSVIQQPPTLFAVQLIISGNNFQSGQGTAYLTVGAGTVQTSTSVLNFTDTEAFPDNTSINSSAALSNSYNYTVKGDSLLFSKTVLNVAYTYKLKKQ